MPDMDEMIRRIRRDMNVQLRKRADRALEDGAGWPETGDGAPAGGADPEREPHGGRPPAPTA